MVPIEAIEQIHAAVPLIPSDHAVAIVVELDELIAPAAAPVPALIIVSIVISLFSFPVVATLVVFCVTPALLCRGSVTEPA